MVPKVSRSGKSFHQLALYLLHDKDKAATADRVRWTHTLNLASDHPSLAVDEMLWTYRAADTLKRAAGIRSGGRPLENPVRHFSLNWHPSEQPSQEHMIETVKSFLAHMGWQEHQALLVAHDDKQPHVHVMLNAVHPETGRALDSGFAWRRAQQWAEQYERGQELIFCEERQRRAEEREKSPTRENWQELRAMEEAFARDEAARTFEQFGPYAHTDLLRSHGKEWETLKAHQQKERTAFFTDGKEVYRAARNAVFREVQTAFRERWREHYQDKRDGVAPDVLAARKAELCDMQKHVLALTRERVQAELRKQRDKDYANLLKSQKEQRAELREAQRTGSRSYDVLDHLYPAPRPAAGPVIPREEPVSAKANGREKEGHRDERKERHTGEHRAEAPGIAPSRPRNDAGARGGSVTVGDLAGGILGGLANIAERLFDGFFGGGAAQEPPQAPEPKLSHAEKDSTRLAAETQAANERRDAEEKALLRSWEDRQRRKRERD